MPRLGILRARDASRERQADECVQAPAVKRPRATRKKVKRARRR